MNTRVIFIKQPDQCFAVPPIALTIGNFDGVHLGHQTMVSCLKQVAAQKNLKSAVMFFEPQPLEMIRPLDAPARLYNWQDKVNALCQLGVDYIFIAVFNPLFRQLSAQAYCALLQRLNTQHVHVGDDFRFGFDRSGNVDTLRQYPFVVSVQETVIHAQTRISSTAIRQLLSEGEFVQAEHLLGRPYHITGRVGYGDQIGRTLDFPTANICLKRVKPVLHGIYAVSVMPASVHEAQRLARRLADSSQQGLSGLIPNSLFGAAHVGTRPAIAQQVPEWRLEVFFPNLQANLYGIKLMTVFHYFLHGEIAYNSLDALKQGIHQDVTALVDYRLRMLQK